MPRALAAVGLAGMLMAAGFAPVSARSGPDVHPVASVQVAITRIHVLNGAGWIRGTLSDFPDGATVTVNAFGLDDHSLATPISLELEDQPTTRFQLTLVPSQSWAFCGTLKVRATVRAPGYTAGSDTDTYRDPLRCPPIRSTPTSLAENWDDLGVTHRDDRWTIDAVHLTRAARKLHAYFGPTPRTRVSYAWIADGEVVHRGRSVEGDVTGLTARVGIQRPIQVCVFGCREIYFRASYRTLAP